MSTVVWHSKSHDADENSNLLNLLLTSPVSTRSMIDMLEATFKGSCESLGVSLPVSRPHRTR